MAFSLRPRGGAGGERGLLATRIASGETLPVAKRRSPHQWVVAAIGLVLFAQLVHLVITDANFEWGVVGEWLFAATIMHGLGVTLELTVICMVVGIVLGGVLATFRLSHNPVLRTFAVIYLSVLRSVPPLVQLIFWYNLAAVLPTLSIGVPFGPGLHSWGVNSLINPFTAAILGLGLGESAFMAEIIRGGIISVPHTQAEAAASLGMTRSRSFFRVVLPQAMRSIVPATGNQVIHMVKGTALVSTIAMSDLLYNVEAVYEQTLQTIPLLIVACFWYLVVTLVLFVIQSAIEAHYDQRGIALSWSAYARRAFGLRLWSAREQPFQNGVDQ